MSQNATNPLHQVETEFHGEVQVFSGRALAPDDPSLEPRVRKGRPADAKKPAADNNGETTTQDRGHFKASSSSRPGCHLRFATSAVVERD